MFDRAMVLKEEGKGEMVVGKKKEGMGSDGRDVCTLRKGARRGTDQSTSPHLSRRRPVDSQ